MFRRNVAQALRDNQKLQQFVLTDVTTTEKVLGTGSYGAVVEVWLKISSRVKDFIFPGWKILCNGV